MYKAYIVDAQYQIKNGFIELIFLIYKIGIQILI